MGRCPPELFAVGQLILPSSLALLAIVTVDLAVTTSTSAAELALDLPAISLVGFPAIVNKWSQFANTTCMDAGHPASDDQRFIPAWFFSSLVLGADGNRRLIQYIQTDEVLPIRSVLAFVAQFSDRLDAQRF